MSPPSTQPRRIRTVADPVQGIRKTRIKRVAFRAGVQTLRQGAAEMARDHFVKFVMEMLRTATLYGTHCGRVTISAADVRLAASRLGLRVYA